MESDFPYLTHVQLVVQVSLYFHKSKKKGKKRKYPSKVNWTNKFVIYLGNEIICSSKK